MLVETKLWRNPESRREVISQVLDYATYISTWGYAELNAIFSGIHQGQTLFSAMSAEFPDDGWDEAQFVDVVNKNLKNARFLLMIVGDGIRTDIEKIVDFLNTKSSMPFDLCLCELAVFTLANGSRLVVPQLTTKTHVIERKVMRIGDYVVEQKLPDQDEPDIQNSQPAAKKPKQRKFLNKEDWAANTDFAGATEEDVLTFADDLESLGYVPRVTGYYVKYRLPESSLIWMSKNGCSFEPSEIYDFLGNNGYSDAIGERLFEDLKPILDNTQIKLAANKKNSFIDLSWSTVMKNRRRILAAFERFKQSL